MSQHRSIRWVRVAVVTAATVVAAAVVFALWAQRSKPELSPWHTVDDWRAAVRVTYRHLDATVGPSGDIIVVGYSNGGALAVDRALDSLADEELRIPDRVILFSPAVGVARLASTVRVHRVVSFMPWFDRLAWTDIQPESDPSMTGCRSRSTSS